MVVLIGIGTDVANARINHGNILRTEARVRFSPRRRFSLIGDLIGGRIGGRIGGINRLGIATSRRRFPLIGRYGYGRDGTLNRVTGYGGFVMDVLQGLNDISTTKQVVNHQISMDERMVIMAERRQQVELQQTGAQTATGRRLVVYQKQGNEELRQEAKVLKLQLEILKLQQEQAKKK